jgi:hypothetical protein
LKIRVTFKDPDHDMSEEAAKAVKKQFPGLSEDAVDAEIDNVVSQCSAWVEYGEYVTIEFDTDAGTATVVAKRG